MGIRVKATVIVLGQVVALFVLLFLLSYVLILLSGIPMHLGLPLALRLLGLPVLLASGACIIWLFSQRSPTDFMVTTYVSLQRLLAGHLSESESERQEPLIITGPQRYVRHPMYSACMVMMLGLWLVMDYTPLLLLVPVLYLWFDRVVTRLEERELNVLFGEDYRQYCQDVPKFIPVRLPRRSDL